MFTESTIAIIETAKKHARAMSRDRVDLESILAAIGADTEAGVRLADCLTGGDIPGLRGRCPELGMANAVSPGKMEPDDNLRLVLETSLDLASGEGVPNRTLPGFIALEHLMCGVAMSRTAVEMLGEGLAPLTRDDAIKLLTSWLNDLAGGLPLGELVGRLRGLRAELLGKVFGQDHAAQAFVEGLYNAQVTAMADKDRKRPEGIFVFAGPPGVGKTYMSELCAAHLKRPYRRFDMTGFTDHQAGNDLIGQPEIYRGAKAGLLTGFVDANPNAILLFDEIEKAHLNTIQLFYQILDAGRLEDKFLKKDVSFRGVIIIFTTNAGRSLYDDPNRMGIGVANSTWHKRTILSALENEKNPSDGHPAFPPAICSRLGQGYAVMFNHLGINELEKIVNVEARRTSILLERQYFKTFQCDDRLPITLVFREGARVDARQLRAETEKFIKAQLFRFCSLYARDRIEDVLKNIDTVTYSVEHPEGVEQRTIEELYHPTDRPKVLLAADSAFVALCRRHIPEMDWVAASSTVEAMEKLAVEDVDMALLDLWMGVGGGREAVQADYMALEAREFRQGREILQRLHERFPLIPVYLLSFQQRQDAILGEDGHRDVIENSQSAAASLQTTPFSGASAGAGGPDARSSLPAGDQLLQACARNLADVADENSATHSLDGGHDGGNDDASILGDDRHRPIDNELFLACVQAGGARGLVSTDFGIHTARSPVVSAREFGKAIANVHHRLYREKKARFLAKERKVLAFDTVSNLDLDQRTLNIRACNFRFNRAIEATDVGAMVDDISRPSTRFDDVFGAADAKKSMRFIVDWLRNPKKFQALGLRPPKGILLTGPSGTGKTMLARALAGEADCAFMETTAAALQSKWHGEDAKIIRDLFQKARRYAPTIIFIDEIDSIGSKRGGDWQDKSLNALLTEMDGFGAGSGADAPVIVIAATNLVDKLDEALKRRFDREIEVDRPDYTARLAYLNRAMIERKGAEVTERARERLAAQSAGMTIADLARIIQGAGVTASQEGVAFNDELLGKAFENARLEQVEDAMRPTTRFADVLGATEAKKTLQFIVNWLRNPQRYFDSGLRPPRGALLPGRRGTGKTMLARAVAGEADCVFLETTAATMLSKYLGENAKNVRDLFKKARRYAPSIVFIDEIDSIGRKRSGEWSDEGLNALLTELDGFGSGRGNGAPVIVLAATNRKDDLDEALKRRFDRIIEVEMPDRATRFAYLQLTLSKYQGATVSEQTLDRLSGQSAGMSLAQLANVFQAAGIAAAESGMVISDAVLEDAFETIRRGEAKKLPPAETLERVARHEAGHTVINWLGGKLPVMIDAIPRGDAGGIMEHEAEEGVRVTTKSDLELRIRISMGGRAAELLYYGETNGLSTSVGTSRDGDLPYASRLAVAMVQELGMDEIVGPINLKEIVERQTGDSPLSVRVARQSRKIVETQLKQAMDSLQKNRPALDALASELFLKNRLVKEEIKAILDRFVKAM